MGILERIKDIEAEIARTQKNKATEYHLGRIKAQLAKLRSELIQGSKISGKQGGGDGFEVAKCGDARVALIGFPSVGKSTLLNLLTTTASEVAEYEFTTLTCVPGIIYYNEAKIQLLDLPGIVEGASEGRGRGRQVIAVARSADLILMIVDATKDDAQKEKLERELEAVGFRLNKSPPRITINHKKTGGIHINSAVPLTQVDDFIDAVEGGHRKYVKCLYVYNKIDLLTIQQIDEIARRPMSVVVSCQDKWNLNHLLRRIWDELQLVRIYTKKRGEPPDFQDPIVLTPVRGHALEDEDVIQIVKKI